MTQVAPQEALYYPDATRLADRIDVAEFALSPTMEALFVAGTIKRETFPSGRIVWCDFESNDIRIRPSDSDAYFHARLRVTAYTPPTLRFGVLNKATNGERHPDIWPTRLVARSILYFESLHDLPILRVQATWHSAPEYGSDNYTQYAAALAAFNTPIPTFEQKAWAASNRTWTGQLVTKRLLFTQVEKMWTDSPGSSHASENFMFTQGQGEYPQLA